jgi:putative hydrolase of the HAD superfamily
MVKGILFDFGGVLVRTATWEPRRRWEEKYHLQPGQLDALVFETQTAAEASLGLRPAADVWEHVARELSLLPGELAQLQEDFFSADFLDQELVTFIKEIRPPIRVGILSNAFLNGREIFTKKYCLSDLFDTMVISAEVNLAKPDIRIYLLAAQRLCLSPDEIVFVDDVPKNLGGARLAGLPAIHFRSTAEVIAALKRMINCYEA